MLLNVLQYFKGDQSVAQKHCDEGVAGDANEATQAMRVATFTLSWALHARATPKHTRSPDPYLRVRMRQGQYKHIIVFNSYGWI